MPLNDVTLLRWSESDFELGHSYQDLRLFLDIIGLCPYSPSDVSSLRIKKERNSQKSWDTCSARHDMFFPSLQ